VLGCLVVFRVTNVDLTVVLVAIVSFSLVLAVELVLSSDSTENVVTSMSSADIVVGSTFTIKSVGVGFGRGCFVVPTKEMVVNCAGLVVDVKELFDDGFLVVVLVEFLRDEIVVLRFTVTFVDATGFLVGFITVDVAFFDGFNVLLVTGLLDGLTVLVSDETDVRLSEACCNGTGFLVALIVVVAGCFVIGFLVR
jgi:hypothetical protein